MHGLTELSSRQLVTEKSALESCMGMGMMGIRQILQESHRDGNRCWRSPAGIKDGTSRGMESAVVLFTQECKRNVETKVHFTAMLLLLFLQWQKESRSALKVKLKVKLAHLI